MHIRTASPDDAEALLAIYAPYVTNTAITFEYDVPQLDEFRSRIRHTLARHPYLVAVADQGESEGALLGYAYAGEFKERAAYDWAIETSIYVSQEARGRGVGGRLHAALKDELVQMGVQNMCACITVVPEGLTADPYITNNSMEFHRHLGYQLVGRFHKVGYKFGRWYDMVWMELMIGDHPVPAPPKRKPPQLCA